MLASSDRAFSAQRAAPSSSKTPRASLRLVRAAAFFLVRRCVAPKARRVRARSNGPRDPRVLYERLLELGERYVVVPAGGGQQTAATGSGRERRGSVEGAPSLLEPVEQSPCLVRSPEGGKRLDLVGDEADRARLADSGHEEPLTLGREQLRSLGRPAERELEYAERPEAVDPGGRHSSLPGERQCLLRVGARIPLQPQRSADERACSERIRLHRPLAGLQRELGRFLGDMRRVGPAAGEILRQRELREDHRSRALVTPGDYIVAGAPQELGLPRDRRSRGRRRPG